MTDAVSVAPVSVVIPTVGRPDLLRDALLSLSRCEPRAAEVLVVDQSDENLSDPVIADVGLPGARTVRSRAGGRGLAVNLGLKNAGQPVVLVVDDDCTVRADWVGAASRAMEEEPEGIVCGRVLPPPGADPRLVPSTMLLETPRDYTGQTISGALFAGNMACSRDAVLAIGGFDEDIVPSAEDCEFCYRWLRAGGRLRHIPDLVVWHQAWRTPEQLERLYVDYYRGLGIFYAKHLAARDLTVLRFLAGDFYAALLSLARRQNGAARWEDARRGAFTGLPRGLRDGWRRFRPSRRADRLTGP